jgi:hypothetical protein
VPPGDYITCYLEVILDLHIPMAQRIREIKERLSYLPTVLARGLGCLALIKMVQEGVSDRIWVAGLPAYVCSECQTGFSKRLQELRTIDVTEHTNGGG